MPPVYCSIAIDDVDLVPGFEEMPREMAADKTSPAGDQDLTHA